MCRGSLSLLIIATYLILKGYAETYELQIEGGRILGTTALTAELQEKFYKFQSIPYAEKPERFRLAKLKQPWTDVIDCTYDKDECVQGRGGVTGSEDCLFLSVYTKNLTGNATVMVWIHGGGFTIGNGSYNRDSPDYFLEEGLVTVSIQYRLGLFGFMSTEDLACPGNLGLKDQVLALQWVQKNIHHFGGNPNDVTIFGQSAGAGSVSLHLNSPLSKGLFKGAIMNSGVSTSLWALNRRARRIAFSVGRALGIFTRNSTVLVERLKKVDYQTLQGVSATIGLLIALENILEGIDFSPVQEVVHEGAFFTGRSQQMLSTGNFTKVPVLAGVTSNETGALFEPEIIALFNLYFIKYDINSLDLIPVDMTTPDDPNRPAIAREIKNKFFTNLLHSAALAPTEEIIKFGNVELFERSVNKFILDVSKYVSDTYYYIFSYDGDFKTEVGLTNKGAAHAEELLYLFVRPNNYSERDNLVRKRAVRMWANFCKYGKPIPGPDPLLGNATWLPASSAEPPFLMNINTTLRQSAHPDQSYLDLYERLYSQYGKGNYGTY